MLSNYFTMFCCEYFQVNILVYKKCFKTNLEDLFWRTINMRKAAKRASEISSQHRELVKFIHSWHFHIAYRFEL